MLSDAPKIRIHEVNRQYLKIDQIQKAPEVCQTRLDWLFVPDSTGVPGLVLVLGTKWTHEDLYWEALSRAPIRRWCYILRTEFNGRTADLSDKIRFLCYFASKMFLPAPVWVQVPGVSGPPPVLWILTPSQARWDVRSTSLLNNIPKYFISWGNNS